MPTTPQELIDTDVRHATFTNRFAGGLANDFDPFLQELRKSIAFRLSLEGQSILNSAKLSKLLKDIRKLEDEIYNSYESELSEELRGFSDHEGAFELRTLEDIAPKHDFDSPTDTQIWAAVRTSSLVLPDSNTATTLNSFVKGWSRSEKQQVDRIIRFGFATGRSISQMTRDISGKNGSLDKKTRANNRAIVRTSVNHVSTNARGAIFDDNDDIVIGYTIIGTLDGRTSDICKGYDHQSFKFSDAQNPKPPFHPNCRSTTTALLDDRFLFDDGSSLRGSVGADGRTQTSAKTSYYQWLKNQGKAKNGRQFVFDTIGRDRGKLLLDGGLSATEFRKLTTTQDGLFKPITLDELRKKDSLSKAFDDSGI